MTNKSYLNLLGLAVRAGKVTLGEESIIKDIQKKRASLVLIANDTAANTRKKLMDKCHYYHVPFYIIDDRQTLSNAIGKTGRVAIAITENGFAKKIASILDE